MGLRILTNLPALAAQRTLETNTYHLNRSLLQLSTGDRIPSASFDPAGITIAERIRAQMRSLTQAQRNSNDAITMLQVGEGGLNEISNILIRLRELSVQAASDTIGDQERGYIEHEVTQLKTEINRIADSAGYNGIQLLNGENAKPILSFQVGSFNVEADQVPFEVSDFNAKVQNLEIEGISVAEIDSAREAMESVDGALQKVNEYRARLGALQNRLHHTSESLAMTVENLNAAHSRLRDVDIAQESSELVKRQIVNAANIAMLIQANQLPNQALKLIS